MSECTLELPSSVTVMNNAPLQRRHAWDVDPHVLSRMVRKVWARERDNGDASLPVDGEGVEAGRCCAAHEANAAVKQPQPEATACIVPEDARACSRCVRVSE